MNIANILAVVVIMAILALAITKIVRDKKRGVKCSGCPHSCTCTKDSCE